MSHYSEAFYIQSRTKKYTPLTKKRKSLFSTQGRRYNAPKTNPTTRSELDHVNITFNFNMFGYLVFWPSADYKH